MDNAIAGIEELKKNVDSLIIIPNDKILDAVEKDTPFEDALKVADEVLHQGIRGIADLITEHSLINLDFADVKTTLKGKGFAHMGIGAAKGEHRIGEAVRYAVCSPLLNTTIVGADSVILNIVGGKNLSIAEVSEAAELVKSVIDYSANVIFGASIDERMADEVEIVVIATGFDEKTVSSFTPESALASAQRALQLSEKIDRAYQQKKEAEQLLRGGLGQRSAYQQGAPTEAYPYAQQPQMYPTQAQPIQPYAEQPVQTIEQAPVAFEPDDPIPETNVTEEPKEGKGGFSMFMKRLMSAKKK
jgi:cell division GTPase FtsZ